MAKVKKSGAFWAEAGSMAIGATIGSVLGMLFSPQSGRKNRQTVAKEGKKIISTAEKGLEKVAKMSKAQAVKASKSVKTVKKAAKKGTAKKRK